MVFSSAEFGAGTGSVFLTSVGCSGTENNLLGCTYSTSTSGCSHSNDAGLRCQCTLVHKCLVYIVACYLFPSHSVACSFIVNNSSQDNSNSISSSYNNSSQDNTNSISSSYNNSQDNTNSISSSNYNSSQNNTNSISSSYNNSF